MSPPSDLSRFDWVAVDTETTGLKWWKDTMFGVSICLPNFDTFYFDVRHRGDAEYVRDQIPRIRLAVAHHAKFDMHVLREFGVKVDPTRWRCTMIRAALINEHHHSYSLDHLARVELGEDDGKLTEIWRILAEMYGGKPTANAQAKNLQFAPKHLTAGYAERDAELAAKLFVHQDAELAAQDLWKVHDLEFRLLPHVYEMERIGVRVDLDYAERASENLAQEVGRMQKKLDDMAGFSVNVNPSNSLKKLISPRWSKQDQAWYAKDGTKLESTPADAPSINADALQSMKMPEAELVLEIRRYRRLRETFINGHVLGHHNDGWIHATINQTKNDQEAGTGTGRFSITDPALQQITKRNKKLAQIIRPCFVPDEGQTWVTRDWDQMDFRIFANYAKVPAIIQRYAEDPDADFHQMVSDEVSRLTGVPLPRNADESTGGRNAKQINLAMVFGMGPGRLAAEMKMPYHTTRIRGKTVLKPGDEAQTVFNAYHQAVPGVQKLLDKAESVAKSRGYVQTMMGRHIRFPGGKSTHKAGGLIFQGTAADAMKLKMCEVCEFLEDKDARLMLTIHDEFNSSMPKDDRGLDQEIKRILETFDGPMQFRVPVRTDAGEGDNWAEASL